MRLEAADVTYCDYDNRCLETAAVDGLCKRHYEVLWRANSGLIPPQPPRATDHDVQRARAAIGRVGLRRYASQLLDRWLGPPPSPWWTPDEETKRVVRHMLGLKLVDGRWVDPWIEGAVVDETGECYCGETVNAAGIHLKSGDVRCYPDEPALPDVGAIVEPAVA